MKGYRQSLKYFFFILTAGMCPASMADAGSLHGTDASVSHSFITGNQPALAGLIIIGILLLAILLLALRSRFKIKKANAALNEITMQLREKARELQQANESKDKFLSIISHDLKNPIGAITGLSELLLDNEMDLTEEDKNKYLKYINDGCHSADALLETLMKWVRSQSGKLEMKPSRFDVSQSVKHAIALVQNAAIRKEIEISSRVPDGMMVYADFEMINTCIINLLTNAVKFTPLKGKVSVVPEMLDEKVSLKVIDTGVGMSKETLEKLFRLDTKTGTNGTANEKGTGLGLLLVKEFIEKNHGKVCVHSVVGEGSTFAITIPKERLS